MRSFFIVTFIFTFFIACSGSNSSDDTLSSLSIYSGECNKSASHPLAKSSRMSLVDKGDGEINFSMTDFSTQNCDGKYFEKTIYAILDGVKGDMDDFLSKRKLFTIKNDTAKDGSIGFSKGNIKSGDSCGYVADEKEHLFSKTKCFPYFSLPMNALISYDSNNNNLRICGSEEGSECLNFKKQ